VNVPGPVLLLMLLATLLIPYAWCARRVDRLVKARMEQWLRRRYGISEENTEED
jgi:hypothetical protein